MTFDFIDSLSWTWHAAFWMAAYAAISAISKPVLNWGIDSERPAVYWIFITLWLMDYYALFGLPFVLVAMAAFVDAFWGPAIIFEIALLGAFCSAIVRVPGGAGLYLYIWQFVPVLAAPPLAILVRLIRYLVV